MNRFRRPLGVLFSLALLLLLVQIAWALSFYPPVPQQRVGLSRPTVSQRIELADGDRILSARMWLDGQPVAPEWSDAGLVSYSPPTPLAEGEHKVRLEVQVEPGRPGFTYRPLVSDFSFFVDRGALAELPAPGPEELRALDHVNQYRAAAGVQPMTYSGALGAAAARHARYLTANPEQRQADPHRQRAGTPRFFGESGGDRARYFAHGGGTGEVINFVARAEEAIDGWMETIYHRLPLLDPGMTMMGYGLAAGGPGPTNVLMAGPAADAELPVLWPYPRQTGVPTGWDGLETPDPFRLYPGARKPVGYTVTVQFGGGVRRLTLSGASLTGPRGAVPVMRFYPGFDDELKDAVAMIPVEPLAPGTTYTASVTGTVDRGFGAQPYDYMWSFTTAAEAAPLVDNRVIRFTSDGLLRSITVEGTGFSPGARIFLGGLPVREAEVEADSVTFLAPAGFAGGPADLLVVNPGGREALWTGFLTGQEGLRFPSAVSEFRPLQLIVGGRPVALPALQHLDGTILLPGEALEALGARLTQVPEINRLYWEAGGRTGDFTLGRTAVSVQGQPFATRLPAQVRNGTAYVDSAFVELLAGVRLAVEKESAALVMSVEGLFDIADHWARDAIVRLVRAGIVSGFGDGSFRPEATLTRAAFLKMLTGARQIPAVPGDAGGFSDTIGHWVAQQGYVAAAVKAGIVTVSEYPGRRLEPDRPIAREEIAVMVTRALGLETRAIVRSVPIVGGTASLGGRLFTDAGVWGRPGHIAEAVEAGIITGYPESGDRYTFRPARPATRAEAAVMTVRALDR